MNRCTVCVMPDTRPDTPFVDGVCQACINYANRPKIDWDARKAALFDLLDRHHGHCIVPSSGGKDSHYQVMKLLEIGANVTVVTATTCHLTPIGRQNIDNLARHATTYEVSPNKTARAKLNRLGLELVGDISWPEHVGIFTTPFKMAHALKIPLVFYGESPQQEYGGPPGSEAALHMTARWRSEFGGFLGLRPSDMVGQHGLTGMQMADYEMSAEAALYAQPHFLGQYLPWDSEQNAKIAIAAGMQTNRSRFGIETPTAANWWPWENLDNAQTGFHDWFMYLKYGYGRGCAQISIDVRAGRIPRDIALKWVEEFDGRYPGTYCGVYDKEVLDQIGVTFPELLAIASKFRVHGKPLGAV